MSDWSLGNLTDPEQYQHPIDIAGQAVSDLIAHLEMMLLIRAIYTETNPIAVKAALKLKGSIKNATLRLPLTEAQPATCDRLSQLFSERVFE